MDIKSFVFNPFYENTYVIWDQSKEALIVDPGCYEKYEQEELLGFIAENKLSVKAILCTHCHIDHVLGNYFLKEHYSCPLWIPKGETEVYKAVEVYGPQWGIHHFTMAQPDKLLGPSDIVSFGETTLKIFFVPGHSPGHLVYYSEPDKKLIGGDVLFKGSIGRTDLPGGNHQELLANIRNKLYVLPEETEVFPGHGPTTTIGEEMQTNPFVKAS